jgi:NTE family protein
MAANNIPKMILLVVIYTIFFFSSSFSYPVSSNPDTTDKHQDLKVGLVLSGGGAKGIAHIGVLEVLEEAGIRVDFISGTSMGSIVGALYSIGFTTDEMRHLAETTDWERLFSDRPYRRLLSMHEKEMNDRFLFTFPITERGISLPSGLVAGQNIFSWLTHHTWPVLDIEDFSQLPIPYATVATDIETGDAVVFREGYLPDAIRASISFPSAFKPHKVDGQSLLDGGLIRNLPVREVLEMGAEYVIAVDVSTPLRPSEELTTITSILTQAVNYRIIEKVNEQKGLADYNIEVRDLDEYHVTDFNRSEEFMEIGVNTARKHLDKLIEIAGMQHRPGSGHADRSYNREDVYIDQVSVTGNRDVPSELILSEVELLRGRFVDSGDVESTINQLYGTQLFDLISYRLYQQDNGRHHLEIRVIENRDDTFRIGARYESQTQTSFLLNTSFRNLLQRGSTLRFNLRLGRDASFISDYLTIRSSASRIGFNARLKYEREQVDYFSGAERISGLTSHLLRGDLFTGTYMNRDFLIGIGIRGDINIFSNTFNADAIPFSDVNHHAVYGKFMIDTFNRRSFPNRGQFLLLGAAFSDELIFSPLNFNEQHFYWKGLHNIHDAVTLQHTVYLGRSFGEELPWSYWYSPNRQHKDIGMIRFGGFGRYELSGRNIQMVSAGIQYEVFRQRFLKFDAYLGNIFDNWEWDVGSNRYRTGFSLSAGALTILGPLEFIVSASSRNKFLYEIQIGYEF